MTLRTPRRRISPRARRRCLAIRNFFQRTFSSLTSPSGIRINSSIALNVTDVKRSVARNDRPLHAGSRDYRDLHHLGYLSRASSTPTAQNAISTSENCRRRWDGDLEQADTKVLYKTTEHLGRDSNDLVPNSNNEHSDRPQHSSGRMNYEEYTSSPHIPKRKSKKHDYDPSRDIERLRSRLGNREAYLIIEKSSSGLGSHDDSQIQQVYQSDRVTDLISPCSSRNHFEYSRYLPPDDIAVDDRKKSRKNKTKPHKSQSPARLEDTRRKKKKNKAPSDEYITDVINQQYKPLNLFGRKASTFSRISAPVCRDHRYSARDLVMADSDMYTCSRAPTGGHQYPCATGVSAMRSVCDTRLYSSHRQSRPRHRRRHDYDYNDSSLYDVVPVKEKSSPKSRRTFLENMVLTEVPPSPRTQRHLFNLNTQSYSDCEDQERRASHVRRKHSPNRHRKPEYVRHNVISEDYPQNRNNRVSPKMARRTMDTAMLRNTLANDQQCYEYPNEVPPSPRTQRPRFNLETLNYSNYEDYEYRRSGGKESPYGPKRPEHVETFRDEMLPESPRNRNTVLTPKFAPRKKYTTSKQDDMAPSSSQQDVAFQNNITNATDTGKAQNGDFNTDRDKTDKALSEIKNILATFLQELKKDSSTTQSDEASGTSNKNSGKPIDASPRGSGNGTSNAMRNSAESSFNSGLVQGGMPTMPPQFVPSYANPYCYQPVMPMCTAHPVPCVHSSCMPAVPSCMCVGAARSNNQPTDVLDAQYPCSRDNCTVEMDATKKESETDELIREIYNYVSQNPSMARRVPSKNLLNQERAARFPVSGGKSMHGLRQDAQVGTPLLRCYSKSCEAITSQHLFDTYYAANPCYSDSILSRETMDMPYNGHYVPRERNEKEVVEKKTPKQPPKQHSQHSKFVEALRLILKNKKDKKEHIHEVCRSEESIEVDVLPKKGPNQHKHDFLAYSMHGQEYLHPPPQRHPRGPPRYEYNYPPYDPLIGPVSERHPYYDYIAAQSAPMYEAHDMQPQIPLCLREVEVKSVGTQSEKKAPYFKLFSPIKKAPPSPEPEPSPVGILRDVRRNTSKTSDASDTKPNKKFHSNPKVAGSKTEPSLYEKIQKDLNKEANMNNALIKKLFYKRNPFSPQNRFVRTIMEKDTPPISWRPRPFFI